MIWHFFGEGTGSLRWHIDQPRVQLFAAPGEADVQGTGPFADKAHVAIFFRLWLSVAHEDGTIQSAF